MIALPLGSRRSDGRLLCDFCGTLDPVVYYPVQNFELEHPAGLATVSSGDRFYACATCGGFVDAGDWSGLRAHVGPLADLHGVRMLWAGFMVHRLTEHAVAFPAGTNPEESHGDRK